MRILKRFRWDYIHTEQQKGYSLTTIAQNLGISPNVLYVWRSRNKKPFST